ARQFILHLEWVLALCTRKRNWHRQPLDASSVNPPTTIPVSHGRPRNSRRGLVVRERQLSDAGTLLALLDIFFQLAAKLRDGILYRPAGSVCQPANGRSWHDADVLGHLIQDLQVLQPPLPAGQPLHNL